MLYKTTIIILLLFTDSVVYGQNNRDFSNDLTEKKFFSVKKNDIPLEVIKLLGCDSYDNIGTRMSQTGCGSGKRIVLNWAVTDKNGFYVIKVATCGAWTQPLFYIVSEGKKYDIDISDDLRNFETFKQEYKTLKH
jgi:hypothetical protein